MTRVTVVIPAYNEGIALGAHLVEMADRLSPYSDTYDFDFLIVDDGSTDETLAIARTFARFRKNVEIVVHDRNYGLGRALRSAFSCARGEYMLVLDADMSYGPELAARLLEALHEQSADVALASAYMRGGSVVNVPLTRRVLSREANRILSFAAKGRFATLTCMVRAYRTSFARSLAVQSDDKDANIELLFDAIRRGGKIVEIPAKLEWDAQRRASPSRADLRKLARQTWATLRLAFTFRPALWLAVPGLFPGLLPLVVAIMLLLHVTPSTLAIGTAVTVVIQYTSLAIFAGQLSAFAARIFFLHKPQRVLR